MNAIRIRVVRVFFRGVVAFLMWGALGTVPAWADVETIQPPDADASLDQNSENLNLGAATFMKVVSWDNGFREADNWRILVRFDLSGIPTGSTINDASLQLCLDSISGDQSTRSYGAHLVTTAWVESEVTASEASLGVPWNNYFGDFDPNATDIVPISKVALTNNPDQFIPWDVTADVQAIVDGDPNKGWLIKDENEDKPKRYTTLWVSKESSSIACGDPSSPKLIVDFTP